ncbi:hypothetical protein B5X24_HaOG212825 [Helicoverpa armigera]|nr:hypothetical protein B5X24_HaOG212825 [Helicoverpa armigera]
MKLLKNTLTLRHGHRKKLNRCVSTWSPLATAFNTRPTSRPIFDSLRERTGLFNKPELVSFEGFSTLKEQAIAATDRLIEEATSNPNRPMVEIFDELSDTLCKVADLAEFVRIAHPQSHFASAAEDACISVSGVVEKLNTHKGLYEALRDSVKRGTSGDQHLAELFLFDFEQSGIQLAEERRRRVVALNDLILQTGQRFMAGAAKPRRVPRAAVPANVRQFFSSDGDDIIVSGVYAECGDAAAREAAYRLYLAPDKQQHQLLSVTLEARHEMASICGFPSYADRAIKASTMETATNVRQFLDILSDNLYDRAKMDFDAMLKMKKQETPYLDRLMCWDTPYFTHKAKTQLLNVANSDFSPYFSLGGCMEGLNMLCEELYGISLKPEEMLPGESWSPDVYKLAVVHESEGLLGYIYCDLYERPGKPHQDCHFTIQGGKLLPDGSYQNPIVVVMLSLSGGHRSGPALLSAGGVDNLFHEIGHALHSMLGRASHQHVAGTRCATDLAEVPSVLMEYFASSPQVFYSALDQHYHGSDASWRGSTTEVLQKVQKQYYGLPYVENTAWQHRFSHLIGYGAKYYSYLISRGIAWSIWHKYFQEQPLCRSAGDNLRHQLLRHGGAVPPKILLRDYLQEEVTPTTLANALAEELDHHKDHLDTVFKILNK